VDQQFEIISKQLSIAEERNEECEEEEEEKEEATIKDTNPLIQETVYPPTQWEVSKPTPTGMFALHRHISQFTVD
jgi:hypothetical protein